MGKDFNLESPEYMLKMKLPSTDLLAKRTEFMKYSMVILCSLTSRETKIYVPISSLAIYFYFRLELL